MDVPPPDGLLDWQGRPWKKDSGEKAAHPNSRFTTPMRNNPAWSPHADDPRGVPISAIIFGGRRASTVPLVLESIDWTHGVFMGATMGSETTAAAAGAVGVLRRDPMAMLPFCGYNIGDYFAHWLKMRGAIKKPPRIFMVNWFRKGADGNFIWPGYGENLRVLKWMLDRIHGRAKGRETPVGIVPDEAELDLKGLDLSRECGARCARGESSGMESGTRIRGRVLRKDRSDDAEGIERSAPGDSQIPERRSPCPTSRRQPLSFRERESCPTSSPLPARERIAGEGPY